MNQCFCDKNFIKNKKPQRNFFGVNIDKGATLDEIWLKR